MTESRLDVLAVGNAIVDVIAHADDPFLDKHGVAKGTMSLIDARQADALYRDMGPGVEVSGGSAANTAAGIASLGGGVAYVGMVRNDQLGEVFAHDIRAAGVQFSTPMAASGPPTARCLILVTPDAQRSMSTYLGACVELGPAEIDPELVAAAGITYLEGYLWDPPGAKEAFRKATRIAHEAGQRVALSLSDPFCVERYRDEFREFVSHGVDILFANEQEILALYQASSFDEALQHVRSECQIAALTRGARGSVVVAGDEVHIVDAAPVEHVVDTTGAGDLFASGFLFGLARNLHFATCARLGGLAAAEVISHLGARPDSELRLLVQGLEFDSV
jgi:sugar/nucleoside kinase (ribokinase family)